VTRQLLTYDLDRNLTVRYAETIEFLAVDNNIDEYHIGLAEIIHAQIEFTAIAQCFQHGTSCIQILYVVHVQTTVLQVEIFKLLYKTTQ
jgi:hypothetical protein